MTFLLVGTKKSKELKVLSPDTYGIKTYGDRWHQEDLVKRRKTWYYTEWDNGGKYLDDTYFEVKCPVLVETSDPDEILNYIDAHYRKKNVAVDENLSKMLLKALDEIEEIQRDWIEWQRWVFKIK